MTDEYTPGGETTPTEDEARAEAEARHERGELYDLSKSRLTTFVEGAMWAASRVSTPPSEPAATMPLLDADGNLTGWSYRPAPVQHRPVPATPPTDDDEREALESIITWTDWPDWNTLTVDQGRVLADAILAAGFRRQAVSTPEAEVRALIEKMRAVREQSPEAFHALKYHDPYPWHPAGDDRREVRTSVQVRLLPEAGGEYVLDPRWWACQEAACYAKGALRVPTEGEA